MGAAVGGGKGPRSDINITPLVDVVLVLLIIFMVLTPLMEKQMAVRVPEQDDKELTKELPPPDPSIIQFVLKVKEDGRVTMNGEQLMPENMVERLKAFYRQAKAQEQKAGPPVVFFDADDKAKYSFAMKALDAVRESTADHKTGWTIGMMTESIKDAAPETPGAPGAPGAPAPDGAAPPAPPPPAPGSGQ